jgi:signal transduction histidine kinase/CheY-like chemotaxis protein
VCGLLLAGIVLKVTWDEQEKIWTDQLEQEVLENVLILGGKLEIIEKELLGILSLFNASERVTREEFSTYVQPILRSNSYIHSLKWVPRITRREREAYERAQKEAGLGYFRIWEPGPGGALVEADDRDELFPVYYTEPFRGNEALLGYDLASHPVLREFLEETRMSGRPLASRQIVFLPGIGDRRGIVVFAPFYRGLMTLGRTILGPADLKGFVVGFYKIKDMIDQMVTPYLVPGINLVIYDGSDFNPENKLYGEPLNKARFEMQSVLNVSGRTWYLVWQGSDRFHNGPNRAYAFLAAGSTLGFAVFLAIIFRMTESRTRQVEQQVQVRTEELTRANEQLKQEIGARIQAEKDLHVAKEEAETASRAKSTFLANMSHEIRTPMNAIIGYAQILSRNMNLAAGQRSNLDNILKSGDHLMSLINDILDISKIEAGKMELHQGEFDLGELVRGIASIIEPRCEEKGLAWEVRFPDPAWVYGDEIKIKQVLINLLGNAVKFTDAGGVKLFVTREDGPETRFEVIDSGKGIAPEQLEKIFEPFHQEQAGPPQGGTGLGLAIAKNQIELMGGTLRLDSWPGEGSRFYFGLLLPPAAGRARAQTRYHPHLPASIRLHALVVDDNTHNRDVLTQILSGAGLDVTSTENGHEALERIRNTRPDIVFMDLRMPVMNGTEALQAIRREFPGDAIKVVAISASAFQHQQQSTAQAGFDAFIPKPFAIERIYDCLTDLLHVPWEDDGAPASDVLTMPITEIRLPRDLVARLKQAADRASVTDLKDGFAELERQGEHGKALIEHLQPHLDTYNMTQIQRILEKLHDA